MTISENNYNEEIRDGIVYYPNTFRNEDFSRYRNIMATSVVVSVRSNYTFTGSAFPLAAHNIIQFNIEQHIPSVISGNGTSDNLFFILDSSFLYPLTFPSPSIDRSIMLNSSNFNNFTKRDFNCDSDSVLKLYVLGSDSFNSQWPDFFNFNISVILF